jgi:S-layer homology domain/WG containing repeat
MIYQKFSSFILSFCISLTALTGTSYASSFTDTQQHWGGSCIDRLASLNLLRGYPDSTFRPANHLTRAEYAILMLNLFPNTPAVAPTVRPIPNFRDLPPQHWAYQSMRLAYQKQIFTGYPDGTMRPNSPITRTEALVILYNLMLSQKTESLGASQVPFFPIPPNPQQVLNEQVTDAAQIPAWAIEKLSGAAAAFLVVDYPQGTHLRPQQPTTRADAAAFICQSLGFDGLVPLETVTGYRKFHLSSELKKFIQTTATRQTAWFDRQREITILPTAPPGWQVVGVSKLSEDRVAAWFEHPTQGQKMGFLDFDGRMAIAPHFDAVGNFSEGLAWVQQDNQFGFILPDGTMAIAPQFDEAQSFRENLAAVRQDNQWGFIDRTGVMRIALQPYRVSAFSDGLARIEQPPQGTQTTWRYGFMDTQGQVVIAPSFDAASNFSAGLASVMRFATEVGAMPQVGYINKAGEWQISGEFGNEILPFSEGLAPRQYLGQYGYIDPSGNWVISPQTLARFGAIQSAGSFQSNFAVVKINNRFGVINRQGQLVVAPIYSAIYDIDQSYAYANYGGTMVSYIGGYDGSANPVAEQILRGGRWGYIRLP